MSSWPLESSTAMAPYPHSTPQLGGTARAPPPYHQSPQQGQDRVSRPQGVRMEIPGGTALQVPGPGLAAVGSCRGLTLGGCLRPTGGTGLGWSPGTGWLRGTLPGDSPHLPLPPTAGRTVTPFPSHWHRARGSGGSLPVSRFGMGGPGPAANTWALKSHPGHCLSVGCRRGVPSPQGGRVTQAGHPCGGRHPERVGVFTEGRGLCVAWERGLGAEEGSLRVRGVSACS